MRTRIKEVGEDELIETLLEGNLLSDDVVMGPGDDCAVIANEDGSYELLKTDCVVEAVHFLPGTEPERVGRKAICRAISDIAAMGGYPSHALVTIATDGERDISEVQGWYRGIQSAASEFGNISIVGGETTSLPDSGGLISITLTGKTKANHYFSRSGAKPGDSIFVTGNLGGSFESGRHLDFKPRLEEAQWLAELEPLLRPTGMMDLSDGLAKDLPRLASQSGGLGYLIDFESIPVHANASLKQAIGEGEDYELLFTAPEKTGLISEWGVRFPEVNLTCIGIMKGIGTERSDLIGGWEHFRE